ncbi:MAG: hypothetical protein HYR88_11735 [Verrucomicrobia bacterium]|nr:hypothetical protein [Verrucomicrobiota bacterium]MBI3867986.1 hypothetical protein [Verrucomicrobiota bacterium]
MGQQRKAGDVADYLASILLLLSCLATLTACQSQPNVRRGGDIQPPWAGQLRGEGLRGFVVTEEFNRRSTIMITATNHVGILKLERFDGLEAESAHRMIEDGIMGLEALYANALSPYPGDISNRVVTEAAYRPKRVADGAHAAFLVFANDRFGYGGTTADQCVYRSVLAWRYSDHSGELTRIRLFVPRGVRDEVLERWLRSIACP